MKTMTTHQLPVLTTIFFTLFCAEPAHPQIHEVKATIEAGDVDTALGMLKQLRVEHPNDVDYVLLHAQILIRQGDDVPALEELRIATQLAPDYEEPWRLRHLLLSRSNDDVGVELATVVNEASDRFPDASWWREVHVEPDINWVLLVGAGHDRLDNGAPSWNRQFVELSREKDSSVRYRLQLSRDQRFDESDVTVLLGSDINLPNDWFAGLEYGTASGPSFSPNLAYSGYLGRALQDGWVLNLQYRRREYDTASVGSAITTAEKYVGEFRFAYSLGISHLQGASNSVSHSLTSNWYYNELASVGLSINSGEEAEAVGPGQVLESSVRGISVSGRHKINDRFGLQWWFGLHDQGDFYRREYLGMAVSVKL